MPSSHAHPAPPVAATSKGGISHVPTPSSLLMLPSPLAMSLIPRMPPLAPNVATSTKPTSSVAHTLLLQQQQQAHFTSGTTKPTLQRATPALPAAFFTNLTQVIHSCLLEPTSSGAPCLLPQQHLPGWHKPQPACPNPLPLSPRHQWHPACSSSSSQFQGWYQHSPHLSLPMPPSTTAMWPDIQGWR